MEEPVGLMAILFLVVKELWSYIKENKNKWNGTERRTASVEEVNNSIQLLLLPLLAKQIEILTSLEKLARENSDRMINLNYITQFGLTGLKENQEKMRSNLHAIGGDMQQAVGLLEDLKRR